MDHSTPAVDCAVAAARYYKRFGWPCTAHGAAVWTLAGQAVDAVDVPTHLGRVTFAALRRHTGSPHDVIEVPGDPGCWRFLVLPRPHTPPRWVAELAGHGAGLLTNADRIELPPTRVPGGELRWVRDPAGELSPLHVVLTALAQAAPPP